MKTVSAVPCPAGARLRHSSPPPLQLFPVWKEIPAGLAAPWPARAPALPAPLAASPGAAAGVCPAPLPARSSSPQALPAPSPIAPRGTAASSTASLMAPASRDVFPVIVPAGEAAGPGSCLGAQGFAVLFVLAVNQGLPGSCPLCLCHSVLWVLVGTG